ncbi:winged helix-turn-helix transcriptional regulator [Nocardia beijingensis]
MPRRHGGAPTIPPQVEYRLTETGQRLAAAIGALADWSREHKDRIADARRHPGCRARRLNTCRGRANSA